MVSVLFWLSLIASSSPGDLAPLEASAPMPAEQDGKKEKNEKDEREKADDEQAQTAEISRRLSEIVRGDAYYDGTTLSVSYLEGPDVESDALLFGKNKKDQVDFLRRTVRGNYADGFCFAGNTFGSFHLGPVFDGPVELEIKVLFQLVEKRPTFLLRIHSSEKEFLATQLGVDLLHKKRKKKRPRIHPNPSKAYRETPQKWLSRTAERTISISYDPEQKTVTCKHSGSGAHTVEIEDAPTRGRVGFQWAGCKFAVTEIKVKGTLDREWALQQLR